MSYIYWDNLQTSTTSGQPATTATTGTASSVEADPANGKFFAPIYIDTQEIISYIRSSNSEIVYFTPDFVFSTVSVGAFSNPSILTTTSSETETTITLTNISDTESSGSITGRTYTGEIRTFPSSSYGKLQSVSTTSSYFQSITGSEEGYTSYEATTIIYVTYEGFEGYGNSYSTTFEVSTPLTTGTRTETTYPTFFGASDAFTADVFTSSFGNRSWGDNDMYVRLYNADSIPDSGTNTYPLTSYSTSQDSTTIWTTEEADYRTTYLPTYTESEPPPSVTGINRTETPPLPPPQIGGGLGVMYNTTAIDDLWGFWNTAGGVTGVHAFISPIALGGRDLENIGVARHKNVKIFFPDIGAGDLLGPRTVYPSPAWAVINGLGITVDGISASWTTITESTTTTLSGTFNTAYSTTSYTTTAGGAGDIAYPHNSSGSFNISVSWDGIFGATTYAEGASATASFLATAASSSTTISIGSNQTVRIGNDDFWVNTNSTTAIL